MTSPASAHVRNDNRNYDYSASGQDSRAEFSVIIDMIQPQSRVIDLGTGNGVLLDRMIKEKNCTGVGIELAASGVAVAVSRGLDVREGRIDEPLPFKDSEFDYAICNVTLQMVLYPEILLQEMKRISRFQIISFPNFAFYKNRIDLLLNGRMPRPMLFGYDWYSTGHIHQLSIADFYSLVSAVGGLKINKHFFDKTGNVLKDMLSEKYPNLFVIRPIFLLEKI